MNLPRIPGIVVSPDVEPRVIVRDRQGPFEWLFGAFTSAIAVLFGAMLITLFAVGIVALFPANVSQALGVLTNNWLLSGVVGALTLLVVPIIAVVLALTICLIPVSLLLLLLLLVAIVAGWTVSARALGERVMAALNQSNWTGIGQTAAGAVVLALLGAVPVLGGLIGFVATALGLGALILTRAGTQPYPLPYTAVPPVVPTGPATTTWPEPAAPVVPMDAATPSEAAPTPEPPITPPSAPSPPTPPADEPSAR
jgi:hypothetical protein